MKRDNKEGFIEKANRVHCNKYDYSKVEYVNNQTKICIICPEHGEFWQTPNNHLKGHGCPKCGKILQNELETKTTEEFINEAKNIHGNKYDYSKTIYSGALKKLCIICPEHGEFWQIANSHLSGCGCKKCKGIGMTTDEWVKKAIKVHGNKYDYTKTKYNGYKEKVCIVCPEHGEFWQSPTNHIRGYGCPNCRNYKLELEIKKTLEDNGINFEQHKRFSWMQNKSVDFYLPEHNAIIECQGIQHFEPTDFANKGNEWATKKYKKTKEIDELKLKLSKENGIKIFYYSNLNIDFPYEVYIDKNKLIKDVTENGTSIHC